MSIMKSTVLICFLALIALSLKAQKIYFIYLQTETGEPFFVRLNDKLYSSTESGYLIVPRLRDSTYNFKLGFPGKNIDLNFKTTIDKKDHGYLIKNLGEKGWGLFDLQTLSLQTATSNSRTSGQMSNSAGVTVNAFTDLLSRATDDPSLKQNVFFAKEEEKKPQPVQAIVKEEKKPEVTETVVKEEKKSEPVTTAPEEKKVESLNANEQRRDEPALKTAVIVKDETYKKSQVTKISETTTPDGVETVFIDQIQDGKRDTVRILIPQSKETVVAVEPKTEPTKEEKKFSDSSTGTAQANKTNDAEVKKEEGKKWWPFGKNKATKVSEEPAESKEKGIVVTEGPKSEPQKAETKISKLPADTAQANKTNDAEVKKEEGKKWWPFGKNNENAKAPAESKEKGIVVTEGPKSGPQKAETKISKLPADTAQANKTNDAEVKKEEGKKWWPFGKNKATEDAKEPAESKEKGVKWWPFNKNKTDSTAKKCAMVANTDDFLKLRRKMASRTNDEGMLEEARKYFKEKCFTTEQVKNLSSMFLSNAGKYNFFELAHNYTSDIENFPSLQSELKDEYYVNRFKNLVGN